MGALLTLYLAARHEGIAGVVTMSPAVMFTDWRIHLIPFIKPFIRLYPKGEGYLADPAADARIWRYDVYPTSGLHELKKLSSRVKRDLPQVTCPILVIHSTKDDAIPLRAAQLVYDRVGSSDKKLFTLHESGHPITVDSEWEAAAEQTYQFIVAHTPVPA